MGAESQALMVEYVQKSVYLVSIYLKLSYLQANSILKVSLETRLKIFSHVLPENDIWMQS